jgi:hypothetical protein
LLVCPWKIRRKTIFEDKSINLFLRFIYLSQLIDNQSFFFVSENGGTAAYPPPFGFCAWAFGGGLAAVLCSAMSYFFLFFFIFFSQNGILSKVRFYYPPQYFCQF